jgi:phage tail tape-measure protein
MKTKTAVAVGFLALVASASLANAQGIVGGARQGAAEGNRAAGPVGGVVGGAVGAGVGGAVGGVKGVLGIPDEQARRPRSARRHSVKNTKRHKHRR